MGNNYNGIHMFKRKITKYPCTLTPGGVVMISDTFYSFHISCVFVFNWGRFIYANYFLSNDLEDTKKAFICYAMKENDPIIRDIGITTYKGATFTCHYDMDRGLEITTHSTIKKLPTHDIISIIEIMKAEAENITANFNTNRLINPSSCYYFRNKYLTQMPQQYGCYKEDVRLFPNEVWSACAYYAFSSLYNLFPISVVDCDGKPLPTSAIMSDKGERILKEMSDSCKHKEYKEFKFIHINGQHVYV